MTHSLFSDKTPVPQTQDASLYHTPLTLPLYSHPQLALAKERQERQSQEATAEAARLAAEEATLKVKRRRARELAAAAAVPVSLTPSTPNIGTATAAGLFMSVTAGQDTLGQTTAGMGAAAAAVAAAAAAAATAAVLPEFGGLVGLLTDAGEK